MAAFKSLLSLIFGGESQKVATLFFVASIEMARQLDR
jgi:hypothetical protein